jgi:hypothetical protein
MQYINRTKDKNNMIIQIDVEKAFDGIQHPLMVNVVNILPVEEQIK